jgi:hypothetical protein
LVVYPLIKVKYLVAAVNSSFFILHSSLNICTFAPAFDEAPVSDEGGKGF